MMSIASTINPTHTPTSRRQLDELRAADLVAAGARHRRRGLATPAAADSVAHASAETQASSTWDARTSAR